MDAGSHGTPHRRRERSAGRVRRADLGRAGLWWDSCALGWGDPFGIRTGARKGQRPSGGLECAPHRPARLLVSASQALGCERHGRASPAAQKPASKTAACRHPNPRVWRPLKGRLGSTPRRPGQGDWPRPDASATPTPRSRSAHSGVSTRDQPWPSYCPPPGPQHHQADVQP